MKLEKVSVSKSFGASQARGVEKYQKLEIWAFATVGQDTLQETCFWLEGSIDDYILTGRSELPIIKVDAERKRKILDSWAA